MKKFLLPALAALMAFVSCTSELEERMDVLESKVDYLANLVNNTISSLQKTIQAVENNDFLNSIDQVTNESGEVIGYTFNFAHTGPVTIYHGQDGATGPQGPKGEDGTNGADGKDGATPVISVKLVDGVYVWTVNGEVLLDAENNPVPVVAATPQIRTNEGKWEISYDNGQTWVEIGAIPTSTTSITAEVLEDKVILYLNAEKTEYVEIPLVPSFSLSFARTVEAVQAGKTVNLSYTVKGVKESDEVVVYVDHVSAGWAAEVDEEAATLSVVVPDPFTNGLVVVAAVNNTTGATSAQALKFEEGVLSLVSGAETVPAEGGDITIKISTNVQYEVSVSESWISQIVTKAVETHELNFTVEPNTGNARTAEIVITGNDGSVLVVVVSQPKLFKEITKIRNLWGYQFNTENPHNMTKDANRTIAVIDNYLIVSSIYDNQFLVFDRMTGEYIGNNLVNTSGIDAPTTRQIHAITSDDAGHLIAVTYSDSRDTDTDTANDTVRGWVWKNGIDQAPASTWWSGLYNYNAGKTWAFSNLKCVGDVTKDAVVTTSSSSGKIFYEIFTNGSLSGHLLGDMPNGSAWYSSNVCPINPNAKTLEEQECLTVSGQFRMYPAYIKGTVQTLFDPYPSFWNTSGSTYAKTAFGGDYIEANGHRFWGVLQGWSAGGAYENGANKFYIQLCVSELPEEITATSLSDGGLFGSRMSSAGGILEDVGYSEVSMFSPFSYASGTIIGDNNQQGDVVFAQSADGSVQVYAFVMNLGMTCYTIEF